MSRRNRRDRVNSFYPSGAEKLYSANGTLPRGSYRDFEASVYALPLPTVYRGREPRRLARSAMFAITPSFPAKQALVGRRFGRVSPLGVTLNRMPSRVRFCVQRGQRREVLFALGRAGYRGSAPKRSYRRSANSNYGC